MIWMDPWTTRDPCWFRSENSLLIAAVLLIVVFRRSALSRGLEQVGLGISVLELGVALILLALSQGVGSTVVARGTWWMRSVGRCSYEIYLTHMFVVFALFGLFKTPVTLLFCATILLSALLGEAAARLYSEPPNMRLRRC